MQTIDSIVRESGLPADRQNEYQQDKQVFHLLAALSGLDADQQMAELWDRLPDLRKTRANTLRARARDAVGEDRQSLLARAEMLSCSVSRLDQDEKIRARAYATELAATVSLQLRGLDFSEYCPSPETVREFRAAHASAVRDFMQDAGLTRDQAYIVANRGVAQAVINHGLQDGVRDFIDWQKRAHMVESGHLRDVSLDDENARVRQADGSYEVADDFLAKLGTQITETHNASEDQEQKLQNAAAEILNDRQYIIFRVLLDEGHGIHFARKGQAITAGKAIRQGVETGEIPAHFVMRAIPGAYHGRGSAQRAIETTLTKLGQAVLQGQDQALSEKAIQRLSTDTRTLVRQEQTKTPDRKEQVRRESEEIE